MPCLYYYKKYDQSLSTDNIACFNWAHIGCAGVSENECQYVCELCE